MRWRPSTGGGEGGAVATLVVVLLSAGVLLGFLALTVDVGRVVLERRELQNGADAGALALAQACANAEEVCDPGAQWLVDLVNANAGDGEHQLDGDRICGTPSELDACSEEGTSIEDIRLCPPLPESLTGVQYVEVHTSTSEGGGGPLVNIFGAAAGADEGGTSDINTCARAAWWSPATTGPTIPLTIGVCAWEEATGFGGVYAWNVVDLVADPSADCSDPEAPGPFGWLDDPDGDCEAEFDAGGGASGHPEGEPPDSCTPERMSEWLGTEVIVPVFTQFEDGLYEFDGVASFYLEGWSESDGVISGWFTSPGASFGPIDPAVTPRGVLTVQMAG